MNLLLLPLMTGFIAIGVSLWLYTGMRVSASVPQRMREIAGFIAEGVRAYLSRQLRTIFLAAPFIGIGISFLAGGAWVAVTFLLGVVTSLLTAYVGMNGAVKANVKTAHEATESMGRAFATAVIGGSIMGFSITGFSLVALSCLYYVSGKPETLVGFGFGASLAALFAQIGGGIYTKAADIGADLVGKIERNIPEDDPRNPAVIADLVGDNVGDCAGRGSDLFQTFSDDIITGMLVAATTVGIFGPKVMFFPLLLQSVGILASLVGVYLISKIKSKGPEASFNIAMLFTTVLALAGAYGVVKFLLNDVRIFFGAFLGVLVTLVASVFTRHYAGLHGRPVRAIADASKRGVALNIITGLASGLQSPIASIVMIVGAVSAAYVVAGGGPTALLAIVAVNIGTDLLIGFIMTADAFGPITDNAAGIAEMSHSDPQVVKSLASLDSVGNTMKAITKAYAMSSGTVTSFVLFSTFFSMSGIAHMDVQSPFAVAFLLLGVSLPYLISSLTIGATARTALLMVDEVRRQFRNIPGILAGTAKPDYRACVDIATANALREMVLPGLVSLLVPVAVGFAFGASALGALLIGSVASAALLGPFFNNTGTSFDNAKKLIEEDGQKGSFEHQAAVAADTVGDPMKDVAGPSLLIFMKLIGMASLLIAGSLRL